MERGVAEQVAEVLKQLQQLVRGVLEDGQHLGGHHVAHHEERRLGEGGGEARRIKKIKSLSTLYPQYGGPASSHPISLSLIKGVGFLVTLKVIKKRGTSALNMVVSRAGMCKYLA